MCIRDSIDSEYDITPELKTVPTPGHTPGHISISVSSKGQRAFVLGDVAHSPAQAHYTNWSPTFDTDPDVARSTRHRVFDDIEATGALVASGHFPDAGYCHLVRRNGRRVWHGI